MQPENPNTEETMTTWEKQRQNKFESHECVKGCWVALARCQWQLPSITVQRAATTVLYSGEKKRTRRPFSLISILQLFDRRNQRTLAPAERLWPGASVCVCLCVCHLLQHTDVLLLMNWTI